MATDLGTPFDVHGINLHRKSVSSVFALKMSQSCRVPRTGDPEYILFWMAGCSACDACKQQLSWCRDCSCVKSVQVGQCGDPTYDHIFRTYNAQRTVPFLATVQDGRVVN